MKDSQFVKNVLKKLDKFSAVYHRKKQYEKLLECLSAKAKLEYISNLNYVDNRIEDYLTELCEKVGEKVRHKKSENAVLFYDGFGLDNRGLVQIYLRALKANSYRIIYVTEAESKEKQPKVMKILSECDTVVYHCQEKNLLNKINWLDEIFCKEKFDTAFFYTTPWDVSGTIAFMKLKGSCNRFQINLTDHAFWIGINAFDYCIEFRNYGAAVSKKYRNIAPDKLIHLPYYPIINRDVDFQGFPFEYKNKKIIFSGGAIYKTIDKEKTYYNIVEHILSHHKEVIFVYAGNEEHNDIDRLVSGYPGRMFHLRERNDLLQVLEKSYLFLNTYPISGALMIQYAVVAKCIPVTLKREWDDDASGILLNEDKLGETFISYQDVCNEIDKLILNEGYYNSKKQLLENQLITEQQFQKRLNNIVNQFEKNNFSKIESVDTELFRKQYMDNLTIHDVIDVVIAKEYRNIMYRFPGLAVGKMVAKIKQYS